MIIRESQISLGSERAFTRERSVRESLRLWVGARPQTAPAAGDRATLSRGAAPATYSPPGGKPAAATKAPECGGADDEPALDAKTELVRRIAERLLGIKVRVLRLDPVVDEPAGRRPPPAEAVTDDSQGWGLEYERHESQREVEATAFSARGTIVTEDGVEVAFSLELAMRREHLSHESIVLRGGDALVDPLVINLHGGPAGLREGKFSFDLDADGVQDSISFVAAGSGFLALDRDGDGAIGDGRELFGPTSGDGFAELAAFDDDGNGWIDEGDAVFGRLLLWWRDAAGADLLRPLAESGVGAIYLGRAATAFSLTDAANRVHGQVASTGLYLAADGTVGTVQQVDLAV